MSKSSTEVAAEVFVNGVPVEDGAVPEVAEDSPFAACLAAFSLRKSEHRNKQERGD